MKNVIVAFRMTIEDKKNLDLIATTLDRNPSDALRFLVKQAAQEFRSIIQVQDNLTTQEGQEALLPATA